MIKGSIIAVVVALLVISPLAIQTFELFMRNGGF